MKKYVNIGLLALLLVVTYQRNTFLNHLVDNMVGKILMSGILYYVTKNMGITSGIILAVVFITLMAQSHDGFDNFTDLEEDKKKVIKGNINDRHHLTITDLEKVMRHRSEVNTLNSSQE